ncbi:hypothetical protein J3P71_20885 [Rhizobium leguminosarum]|uniref:ComEC/Rec2 family competence protein n=1 Tax=Rhizobium leguminosarum TaxID=384 RepID=UPI0014419C04|nr:hypothetical protein [Rhizobium leguminosarum]MBY5841303.1 hypothetical protein [Rhizobium leguminosarum]NKM80938.1 hypothetical protein [Rhizobium leguminosarum bv. viciae]QSZ07286.1 hypothetical protein J3P71_20885 [Rhizobium leguminosarum]
MPFTLTMYPALDGDCLLIQWGSLPDLHHMIVDLGRSATWETIGNAVSGLANLELLAITHVDADHISGCIPMIKLPAAPFHPNRVWFNAHPQLIKARNRFSSSERLGARQGEKLSRGIANFDWPQNADFASGVVSTDSPEAQSEILLPGGAKLRLLSPNDEKLAALLPHWERELQRAKIRPFDPDEGLHPLSDVFERFSGGPDVRRLAGVRYVPDAAEANGSSIAFILEYEGKRLLLCGDAHSETLEAALRPLAEANGGQYRIDLMKVSHHGSRGNTSPSLLKMIDCDRYAISTNGSREHCHPHEELIARIVSQPDNRKAKTIYCNYRQAYTTSWQNRALSARWNYEVVFPDVAENGMLMMDI